VQRNDRKKESLGGENGANQGEDGQMMSQIGQTEL